MPYWVRFFRRQILRWNQRDIHPDLLENRWNVVARAHDVADFQIVRDLHIDDADLLPRWLVVVEAAQIFTRDERVSLAVFLAFGFKDGTQRRASLLQIRGR